MLARLIAWLREPVPPIMTGYQPRDTGPQGSPPCGDSSARRAVPYARLSIPMPAGVKPPRQPCECCGR